jgi:hypothetical protein
MNNKKGQPISPSPKKYAAFSRLLESETPLCGKNDALTAK